MVTHFFAFAHAKQDVVSRSLHVYIVDNMGDQLQPSAARPCVDDIGLGYGEASSSLFDNDHKLSRFHFPKYPKWQFSRFLTIFIRIRARFLCREPKKKAITRQKPHSLRQFLGNVHRF